MSRDENCGSRMKDHRPIPPSEQPKVEPEIIPPGAPGGRQARIWLSADDARFIRIETRGPVAIALALLMLGVIFVALLALLLGIVLLWIPLALGFAAAVILSWLFRGRRR
jgi:hypothetical protein